MKHILPAIIFLLLSADIFSQSCTVTGTSDFDTIVCGDHATLSAYGRGQGIAVFSEDFNSGGYGPGWSSTTQAMFNNPCGPNTIDNSICVWMGNSSPVPRILTTAAFNLSSCTNAGVTICYDMRYAIQGDPSPCEGPDLPTEGVYLQYSIDNGTTWVTINYTDPNGGYDPVLTTWNNYCYQVPTAALAANTKFRWYQDNDSGADYDHWGIDNVVIYCNDPSYNIVWQHDMYNEGPTGGVDPNLVSPHTTTSYYVVMSNGTITCRDTVTVVVRNPTVVVDAGNDTSVCVGTCAQLHATAKVVKSPAKQPTYTDAETATVSGTPGFPGIPPFIPATPGVASLAMGINVTGLNQTTVNNGLITSVCIGSLSMLTSGINIFDIYLICPSGDSIKLVPDSTLTGSALTNTCFVPAGGNINSASSPYTGSYSPAQSFSGLNGCNSNGQWTLHFLAIYNAFTLPVGSFNSWSISFNDPEISYTGNFNWSPTTNMTGSATLTPTVCPTGAPQIYTLTMSDTAGCATSSDAIQVSTHTCCTFGITAAVVQPACNQSNGSVNLTIVPPGAYTFHWGSGAATASLSNLAAGAYPVTITDPSGTCTKDTIITLTSSAGPSISNIGAHDETCLGQHNGSASVIAAGGTGTLTYLWTNAGTTDVITGLVPNTYTVTVTDAASCSISASVTVAAGPVCCNIGLSVTATQPTCGTSNGTITLNVLPAGNYSYTWSDGGAATANRTNLGAGAISVTITDNNTANCTKDSTINLNSNSTLAVAFSNQVNPTCANNDGSITASLNGGTAPYTVTIDTGGVPQTITVPIAISQALGNLHAGVVNVSVTDAAGCQASVSATLVLPANCCQFSVSANITQPACGQTNGGITLTTANGSGNYAYNWSGGLGSTNSITGQGAGNYAVTITDNAYANCSVDTSFTLNNPGAPVIDSVIVTNETCQGLSNGTAAIYASGGSGTLTYLWGGGQTTTSLNGLAPNTYSFTVTDATSCAASGTATIGAGPNCCPLVITTTVVPPACGQNNASITVNIATAGTPPYTYSIDGVNYVGTGVFNNVPSGNYNVITADAIGCHDTIPATVPALTNNLNVTDTATNITCFGANDGSVSVTVAGGNTPYTYVWNIAGSLNIQTNLSAGSYSTTVTDVAGCTGTGTASVTQPPLLTVNAGNDVTVCTGQLVTLDAGSGYTTYQWSSGETSQLMNPVLSAEYYVTVTNATGCSASDSVNVVFVPAPVVDLGDDKVVYTGDDVLISAAVTGGGSNGNYNWQPDTLLTCGDCASPVAFAQDTITYTLVYHDQYGCTASDDITLFVLPVGEVYFPNAFTPNGDGNNDLFLPYGSGVKQINLTIFDRWGEKVFDSENFYLGWDGTYKHQPLPMGVYVYRAKVVMMNDKTRDYMGSVTLIR